MPLPIRSPDLSRLATWGACGAIDADGVDVFDRYARLAATVVGTPMAAISFLDGDHMWCKAVVGLQSYDMTRCGRFCAQTMLTDAPLLVPDARLDPRFADSPVVRNPPGLRFYLGAPLRMPNGQRIGAVSAFSAAPRSATVEMTARLADLADAVVTTLGLYRTMHEVKTLALSDGLTGLPNRVHLYQALSAAIEAAWQSRQPLAVLYIDCDKFKQLNDGLGHLAGDQMLQALGASLRDCLRPGDLAARLAGDEFVVLLPDTAARDAGLVADRIRIRGSDLMAAQGWPTTLSIGAVTFVAPPATVEAALAMADKAMYAAKEAGGDRVRCVVAGDPMAVKTPQAVFRKAFS
jgi:diguanylate cyclase (GGDEF)-like protein